jgi:PAS domain S-box-containing protein
MKILRNRHFWIILAFFLIFGLFQYVELLNLSGTELPSYHWGLTRHAADRFLLLFPVIYTAWVFGYASGTWVFAGAFILCIPRTLFMSPSIPDAIIESIAFLLIGVFIIWLVRLKDIEKKRADKNISALDSTYRVLQNSLDALTKSEKRLTMLNAASEILNSTLDLQSVFQKTVHLVSELMSTEITLLYTMDAATRELTLVAYEGVSEEFARTMAHVRTGEGTYGEVAQTGKTVLTETKRSDFHFQNDAFYKMKIQVQLCVPLLYQKRVIGIMCVGSRRPREFTTEDGELLGAAGKQVAIAAENARLYEIQKQIANRLEKSEGDYRRLFEAASDAIWAHDLSGKVVMANKAAVELIGMTPEQLIGGDIRQFLTPEGLEIARSVRRALLTGTPFQQPYELKLIRPDKTEIIYMVSSSLVRHADEEPVFEHVARDITKERRMQDNLRHYVQQITRIQEEERARIARDLHDDTAQALYVLTRKIDNFARTSSNLPPETSEFLDGLGDYVRSVLQGVRRFSQDLRPPMLDDLGLLVTIRWLLGDMEERTHVKTSLTVSGEQRRLATHVELAVFRIVQEALRNVEKHAQAKSLVVNIAFEQKTINISITDDGKGFKLAGEVGDLPREGRLGLMGMDERARLLGGKITINSELKHGTTLLIELQV